jgi:hypothetical protein
MGQVPWVIKSDGPWGYIITTTIPPSEALYGKRTNILGLLLGPLLGFYHNPDHGSFIQYPYGTPNEVIRYFINKLCL